MKKARLLVADDDSNLRAALKPLLELAGFAVSFASDGHQALNLILQEHPDLVILDILMPKLDGHEVLHRLRQANDLTPVILLTELNALDDKLTGFEEGADDYLPKPFDKSELVARVRAVLRRTQHGGPSLSSFRCLVSANLVLDRQTRQASFAGKALNLTVRSTGILEYLMLHPLEIISRERFLQEVWGWPKSIGIETTRAVDIRISEIRKALKDDADSPKFIETITGTGYRFVAKVEGRTCDAIYSSG